MTDPPATAGGTDRFQVRTDYRQGSLGIVHVWRKQNMGNLSFLTRAEIESLGPPTPEELEETGVSDAYLRDLTLKHVASLADPTTISVAEKLHLPPALTDELLYQLYREKLIEIRLQSAVGLTRYAMLDHGWERVLRLQSQCGYMGPAPVTLDDYTHKIGR